MDDFLILSRHADKLTGDVTEVLEAFGKYCSGLNFTHEEPREGRLQFLDLRLSPQKDPICCMHEPSSKKGILRITLIIKKIVKKSVASMCLEVALKTSCRRSSQESFEKQVVQLERAAFPRGTSGLGYRNPCNEN